MPLPLTEADAYTADVTVPEDGDSRNAASVEGPFQALANRTEYLLRRGRSAAYHVTASGVGAGATLTLTTQRQSTGFSVAANAVTVPAAGVYLALVQAEVTDDGTSDPELQQIILNVAGSPVLSARGYRPSATASQPFPIVIIGVLEIATPGTETITLTSGVPTGPMNIAADSSYLTLVRLSEG